MGINRIVTEDLLEVYLEHLRNDEKSTATLEKYERDVRKLMGFVGGREITKMLVIEYKDQLLAEEYEPTSINSMLAAVNGFLVFCGLEDCRVNRLNIQQKVFCDQDEELTKGEYEKLLKASKDEKHQRINLVIQTICGTGIRVSELQWITVEAVKSGRAIVSCKGKMRKVFIPDKLKTLLMGYIKSHGIERGPVFVTCNGKPLNRSNIWREMKALQVCGC